MFLSCRSHSVDWFLNDEKFGFELECWPQKITLSGIMLKNVQTYFNKLPVFVTQNFQSMFGSLSALTMKRFTDE